MGAGTRDDMKHNMQRVVGFLSTSFCTNKNRNIGPEPENLNPTCESKTLPFLRVRPSSLIKGS